MGEGIRKTVPITQWEKKIKHPLPFIYGRGQGEGV
jgi:hypothetical protein